MKNAKRTGSVIDQITINRIQYPQIIFMTG